MLLWKGLSGTIDVKTKKLGEMDFSHSSSIKNTLQFDNIGLNNKTNPAKKDTFWYHVFDSLIDESWLRSTVK
jgi:hypothetical protein